MGSCLSSDDSELRIPTAKVVSVNGDLHEYNVPVLVSQVLQSHESSSSSSSTNYFLCNSDRLYYDDYIPALDSEDQLQPNQIYFILPTSKLQYRLSASDMAALAVKASVALRSCSQNKGTRRRKKNRISPVLMLNQNNIIVPDSQIKAEKTFGKPQPRLQPDVGVSRSGSVRRLHKSASRRAKLAVRSFRLRLNTIYEGTVL
ncbi:putative Poly polymerase 1 [Tripterygium wilfordii]|uniref:Putative Poly polymerase 1 n=1 Tax=Tripterygium wilfordii TaxID=458696 RepID=A0A7J7D3T5_TRIWF|nr:uncharacterized protein LOC120008860 [Tripterygium wilfordii]KAF5741000.1 putative Poly polymerase 1 [Tripterygium wilfordii]